MFGVSACVISAFPTAEGYGRFAIGGRGGRVFHVTNLNDSGPGSLREAVEATGPRTVVFDVSGLISLESKLVFRSKNEFLTIAGQTAPGKGICVRNYTFGGLGAQDTIMRYVRLRLGNLSGKTMDGIGLAGSDHCIIDHCSISWTIDEAFSSRGAKNITFQRNLISEALNIAGHKKYGKGFRSWLCRVDRWRCRQLSSQSARAQMPGRNWSLAGSLDQANVHAGRLDIRNMVVYNWKHRTTDGGAREVNFVNNYYKPGPASEKMTYLISAIREPCLRPATVLCRRQRHGRHHQTRRPSRTIQRNESARATRRPDDRAETILRTPRQIRIQPQKPTRMC